MAVTGRPGTARRAPGGTTASMVSCLGALASSGGRSLLRHRFAITLTLVLLATAWIIQQVLTAGSLVTFDYTVHYLRLDLRYPHIYDAMFYLVMIGQRGPTLIPALIIIAILAWRRRSWRPLLVLGFALLALNVVVGGAKFYTARLAPYDNTAALYAGGTIFPSGHASNVIVTWGIVVYALMRYGPLRHAWPGAALTTLASLIVGVASIYLDTHWFSDIIAGWLIGVAILMATIAVDRRRPLSSETAADVSPGTGDFPTATGAVAEPSESGVSSGVTARR